MYNYYNHKKHNGFDFSDFEITYREIIASVFVFAVMMIIGLFISTKINERFDDKQTEYNQAIQIDNNQDLFEYGMRTNVGNAFVYGDLIAIDTVTYPEIGGSYMYIEKVEEHYKKHTRTVTYTDSDGKKHTKTETYWTWDEVDSWDKHSKQVTFCGVTFNYGDIYEPSSWGADWIDTQDGDYHVRYKYYGCPTNYTGTIYTKLSNNTVNNTTFYNNNSIEETLKSLSINTGGIIFWIFWVILSGAVVFGFYYLDNKWLED